jgi:hypothetical protein
MIKYDMTKEVNPMRHEIVFSKRERNGKISLWVGMDDNGPYNIWDLSEKDATNQSVLSAIKHAFELGWRACHEAHSEVDCQIM